MKKFRYSGERVGVRIVNGIYPGLPVLGPGKSRLQEPYADLPGTKIVTHILKIVVYLA